MKKSLSLILALFMISFSSCNNESSTSNESIDTTSKKASKIIEENINYVMDTITMNGYVAFNENVQGPRPAVIIVHEWWGLNDYSKRRAKELADMGYIAIAIDMYGNGQTAATPEEAMKLAGPFYANPQMAKNRIDAAITRISSFAQTDTSKIAAIGYCFGGSMVLNAAKLGSDLDGVVSFHGGLAGPAPSDSMKAEILVCHGAADSFIPDQDSTTFRNQLDEKGAEYDFKSYSGAKHAFTNPAATATGKKFNLDISYNEEADKESWNDMKMFLQRIFR